MTLKFRLAVMMTVLLIAVTALQFLLTQREQRDLADRIAALNTRVSSSTEVLSRHMLRTGSDEMDWLSRIQRDLEREGVDVRRTRSLATFHFTSRVDTICRDDTLVVIAEADSAGVRRRLPGGIGRERVLKAQIAFVEDSLRHDRDVRIWRGGSASDTIFGSPPEDFVLNFPLLDADSLHVVEIRYRTDELTDALARSRNRSIFWMTSLLGIGVVGAVLMATQFTRPIRGLEQSFRRVESGDLATTVKPERDDEIGRLTTSFNHMVGRLREGKELERRLVETERLAAIGRLAAGVAHEVRNPLNAVQLNLQHMRDKTAAVAGDEAAGIDRYYDTVRRELSRLEHLVTAFLDLSRAEGLEVGPIDAAESLRSSVELFRPDANANDVVLTLDAPDALPVQGDPGRLTTVWHNLLSNALAACAPGGHVRAKAVLEGGVLVVTVSDDGAGIPEDVLPHIWDPFFSRRSGGTGLGLSIVRSVVERHGGSVSVTSTPGEGTTFGIKIPATGRETTA